MAQENEIIKFTDLTNGTTSTFLLKASEAYMYAALDSYLKIEAKASTKNTYTFSHSANTICSLTRSIEHLLKLKLLKIDPMLIYPMPRDINEYCYLKQLPIKTKEEKQRKSLEKYALRNTITYSEALRRLEMLASVPDFDFKPFRDIYHLRNRLEHNWDNNEEFLVAAIAKLNTKFLPTIELFLSDVLQIKAEEILNSSQRERVNTLDRAIKNNLSLMLQEKVEN